MSDLLQEIDEAIRRDKAAKFWKENSAYILGGAIGVVLMTGAFTAWNAWTLKNNIRQTSLLISALQTTHPETALEAAAKSLKGSHKAVAMIQAAGYLAQEKNKDSALAMLHQVQGDMTAPGIWRDLARLMAVRIAYDEGIDESGAKALYDDLKPLLSKKGPWEAEAQIQAAIIAGESLKDYKAALLHLNSPLTDKDAPDTLKERAAALDHLYSMKNAAMNPA
ncbi:MAG TPA: hypothetical protein VIF12_02580, partial [Micavibrio sp.]